MVNKMLRVKIIDENHEKDLENSINSFKFCIKYLQIGSSF